MNSSVSNESILLDELFGANGIRHILDVSSAYIGVPLVLFDNNGVILAKTAGSEPLAEYIVENGNRSVLQNSNPLQEIKTKNGSILLQTIFLKGSPMAKLGIYNPPDPLPVETMNYIENLGKAISIELRMKSSHTFNYSGSNRLFFDDLLEGRLTSQEMIESRIQRISWNPKDKFVIFVFPVSGGVIDAFHLDSIQQTLNNLMPGSLLSANEQYMTLLATMPMDTDITSGTIAVLSRYLGSNGLHGGMSSYFIRLNNAPYAVTQAKAAIELAEKTKQKTTIAFYDDFQIYHMLDACSSEIRLRSLCMPTVFQLQEYDQHHTTKLTETLRCYLKNALDINRTAAELSIHRNTLAYRLEKLHQILRVDFTSGDDIMRLILSYRILDYLEKIQ